jgi:hypothetical protein
VERAEVDWAVLVERVRARQVSRTVFAGLLLAADVLGARVPAETLAAMRGDGAAVKLAARFRARLLAEEPAAAGKWAEISLQLATLERRSDRLRYWWSQLAPALADSECLRLPRVLYPLYYVFRPMRLAVKYATLAVRRG